MKTTQPGRTAVNKQEYELELKIMYWETRYNNFYIIFENEISYDGNNNVAIVFMRVHFNSECKYTPLMELITFGFQVCAPKTWTSLCQIPCVTKASMI